MFLSFIYFLDGKSLHNLASLSYTLDLGSKTGGNKLDEGGVFLVVGFFSWTRRHV